MSEDALPNLSILPRTISQIDLPECEFITFVQLSWDRLYTEVANNLSVYSLGNSLNPLIATYPIGGSCNSCLQQD